MVSESPRTLCPLSLGPRITLLPVVHGSGACALAVRKWLLEHPCDCLAVGLPESFRYAVLDRIQSLPRPSLVLQQPVESPVGKWTSDWNPSGNEQPPPAWSYVPIDPCQPVIMALRLAVGEHWNIEFCDLETNHYEPITAGLPDGYALRQVSMERFSTAVLPSLVRPDSPQASLRMQYMAGRLKRLEKKYRHIVAVCSLLEWPWLREAYQQPTSTLPAHDPVEHPVSYSVHPNTLIFLFGELPFITGLYERARMRLEHDENLAIDGIKQLLLSARSSYMQDFGKRARRITPLMLTQCLKYMRNLSLLERRMTPDMYTMAVAAQQILGDQLTIHLIEAAKSFPFVEDLTSQEQESSVVHLGIDQARLPQGDLVNIVSRLPGQPMVWRSLELRRKPSQRDMERWRTRWDPYSQCSWPPEDHLIESFRTRVADRARELIGADLARTEKFSTSIQDGIDIRETLRHWYDGDLYVKVMPPSIGTLDCVVMLFDTPADPRDYPWRTTWFAEHQNESTLAFFASDFSQEMVGPGIALATYGGALFLFPPMIIPDIWRDPRLDLAEDLEERLIAAGCLHSQQRHIALLSPKAPGSRWRRIARHFRRQLVHIPISKFNDATVQQLRMVHVLNGKHIRSFAEHFIRKA